MPKKTVVAEKSKRREKGKQINPTLPGWLHGLLAREGAKRQIGAATLASLWLFEYAREKFPECEPE